MNRSAGFAFLAVLAFVGAALIGPPESATAKAAKKHRKKKPAAVNFDPSLPVLGTRLAEFPAGEGKALAEKGCQECHSADMLRQQRLNEKQWTAEVNKMIGWGSEVPEDKRAALVSYLVENFGPGNDKFQPVIARPVGR
jgi:mono/diheme cytochrome c family protein